MEQREQLEIVWEERTIKDMGITIQMPEKFFEFNNDFKEIMYPYGNMPRYVFGGEDIQFQMMFNITPNKIADHQIKEFLPIAKKIITQAGPKVHVVQSGIITKEEHQVAVMEFVSRAVDMSVYNVMFYYSLQEQLMMGSINFPFKDKEKMIPVAKDILESLRFLKEAE